MCTHGFVEYVIHRLGSNELRDYDCLHLYSTVFLDSQIRKVLPELGVLEVPGAQGNHLRLVLR